MIRKPKLFIGTIVIGLGLGAVIASQTAGNTRTEPVPDKLAVSQPAQSPAPNNKSASVADLVGPLAKRLAENPNDASSWVLLAKSYDHMQQPEKAAEAYKKAIEYGNVDPATTSALIAAEAKSGGQFNVSDPTVNSASSQANFDARAMVVMGNKIQGALAPSIRGQVSLAAEFSAQVAPDHAVYIYAKESGGAPMPLAVVRGTAAELPITFKLDDSMAMVPGRTLSSAKQITIVARVSASGNANSQPGDLFAESAPIDPRLSGAVNLVINKVVRK